MNYEEFLSALDERIAAARQDDLGKINQLEVKINTLKTWNRELDSERFALQKKLDKLESDQKHSKLQEKLDALEGKW